MSRLKECLDAMGSALTQLQGLQRLHEELTNTGESVRYSGVVFSNYASLLMVEAQMVEARNVIDSVKLLFSTIEMQHHTELHAILDRESTRHYYGLSQPSGMR